MMKKLGIGIIGCGRHADISYFPWYIGGGRGGLASIRIVETACLSRKNKKVIMV